MRIYVKLGVLALAMVGTAGCGGSDMSEGIPQNVDMTKDFSPKVDMPTMSPKVQQQSKKAAAAAAKSDGTPGAK